MERQAGKVGEGSAQDEGAGVSDTVRIAPANGGGAGTKDKFACNFTGDSTSKSAVGFASPAAVVELSCAVLTFTAGTSKFVVLTVTAGTLNSAMSLITDGTANGGGPDGRMTVDAPGCAIF